MQLLMQTYDSVELHRLRAELEQRRIKVHISDEFTYAIPGMPGAEQPRGVWVDDDDLLPARQVVTDLFGKDRVASDNRQALPGLISFEQTETPKPTQRGAVGRLSPLGIGLILLFAIILFFKFAMAFSSERGSLRHEPAGRADTSG